MDKLGGGHLITDICGYVFCMRKGPLFEGWQIPYYIRGMHGE